MKKYQKVKVVATNNPQGSYAAGCGSDNTYAGSSKCKSCERTA